MTRWRRALLIVLVIDLWGAIRPAAGQAQGALERELQCLLGAPLTLYRGSPSASGFESVPLAEVASLDDFARAVAARLGSRSTKVAGLTSVPQVAASFALGVRDADPNTVRSCGAASGFIGITEGRLLPGDSLVELLDTYGTSKHGLNLLLQRLGSAGAVVDAAELANALMRRFPGVISASFRRLIDASLEREAEYLVFGKTPRFSSLRQIQKSEVIDPAGSVLGAIFKSDLSSKLARTCSRATGAGDRGTRDPAISLSGCRSPGVEVGRRSAKAQRAKGLAPRRVSQGYCTKSSVHTGRPPQET